MYINFQLLYSKGFTDCDLITLQKIKQKEILPPEIPNISLFENLGLIQYLQDGQLRISKKGNAFLEDIQIPLYTDEVKEVVEQAIILYNNYNKPIGNKAEIKSYASWFMSETGFSKEIVISEIENYLMTTDIDYISKLDNLIWKQPNVFTSHKSLKNSKLFDIISTKYKLNQDYFLETKNKEIEWLFGVANLRIAKNSEYFTSYEQDKKKIEEIKKMLFKK